MPTTVIRMGTKSLNKMLVELLNLVVSNHEKVKKAIRNSDPTIALEVLDLQRDIEAEADDISDELEFLITKAPLEKDLRRTITYIQILREITRISEYARHMARYVIKSDKPSKSSIERIDSIHKLFRSMLKSIVKAVESEDPKLAVKISKTDNEIDELKDKLRKKIISSITLKSKERQIQDRIFALSIISSLERAADHIVTICELILYIDSAKRENLS